jgi:hypothetical protein
MPYSPMLIKPFNEELTNAENPAGSTEESTIHQETKPVVSTVVTGEAVDQVDDSDNVGL